MDQKTAEGRRLSGQNTSRLRALQNDPSGLYQGEVFGNSIADSVSFRFPRSESWRIPIPLQHWRSAHGLRVGFVVGENGG
jgi:hypothetical protein